MNSKVLKIVLIIFAAGLLVVGSFSGGIIVGWMLPEKSIAALPLDLDSANVITPQDAVSSTDPLISNENETTSTAAADTDTLFEPFWEAWDIVHDQYVDQPVNDLSLMQGAISGMLDSLGDQHTSYMNPEEYEQSLTPLEGEYEGIGAWVDTTGDYLTIISPIPDSPAEAANLQPGDQVIAIDGEDMTGINGDLVLKKVLGPAGTDVTLTIYRETSDETLDVTITRAKVTVPSVVGEIIEDSIAYVQLSTFGQNTQSELRKTLKELLAEDPSGLILDLRNNGGGYLTTAVDVISEFVDAGQVALIEEMGDGSRNVYDTQRGGLATDIPLVVLINGGSASASEITAGAIQDYGRGTLVGTTSYGKGSVQNWIPLSNDQGAVRVTIARWLTPAERQIHEIGLDPDVVVEYTEEDFNAGIDPQLDKAVEILQGNE